MSEDQRVVMDARVNKKYFLKLTVQFVPVQVGQRDVEGGDSVPRAPPGSGQGAGGVDQAPPQLGDSPRVLPHDRVRGGFLRPAVGDSNLRTAG